MKIVVVGGGAREHALAARLVGEPGVAALCAPGNPGIARELPVAAVDATDPDAVLALAESCSADLTVVGPEAPLAAGVADRFAVAGRPLFGPTRAAARLETSKAFAKEVMASAGVPTARARICDGFDAAIAVVRGAELGWPLVVKADGLAGGKGVVIAADAAAADAALRAAMLEGSFGAAGARVVLEECLVGEELSYFVVADGERFVACGSAQDHKRLLDDDEGPNTGGMGAFAPSVRVDDAVAARIEREIVAPTLAAMAAAGTPFRGFLYCGLMLTADGPKVIEFNCRFGDPEAQVVLPLLDEPLSTLLWAASTGAALPPRARFSSDVAAGVVLAAAGYPGPFARGAAIRGLDRVAAECPAARVRFAGVAQRDAALVTAGGRVLTVVGQAATYRAAIDAAYDAARRIHFDGMQFRHDIGARALAVRP
ncbi:MAG: phosphoribosylamine--glycine ligase [Vicinamibacterales bacterium]